MSLANEHVAVIMGTRHQSVKNTVMQKARVFVLVTQTDAFHHPREWNDAMRLGTQNRWRRTPHGIVCKT